MGKLVSFNEADSFEFEILILSSTCLGVRYKNKALNDGSVYSCINTIHQILDDLNPSQVLNIDKACEELEMIQNTKSEGRCAEMVRKAMDAAGLVSNDRGHAKYYHTSNWLKNFGYHEISEPASPLPGDIAVQTYEDIQPSGDEKKDKNLPYGHISMWTGKTWISDFRQHYPRGRVGQAHFYRLRKNIQFTIRNINKMDPYCESSKNAIENRLNILRHGYQNQVDIRISMY